MDRGRRERVSCWTDLIGCFRSVGRGIGPVLGGGGGGGVCTHSLTHSLSHSVTACPCRWRRRCRASLGLLRERRRSRLGGGGGGAALAERPPGAARDTWPDRRLLRPSSDRIAATFKKAAHARDTGTGPSLFSPSSSCPSSPEVKEEQVSKSLATADNSSSLSLNCHLECRMKDRVCSCVRDSPLRGVLHTMRTSM